MISRKSCRFVLEKVLINQSLLESFPTVPSFLYLETVALAVVQWRPITLEIAV